MKTTTLVSTSALLALAATLGGSSSAWAQGESWVQDNGISCKVPYSEYASVTRSLAGFRNVSGNPQIAFCPITPPAFDSEDFAQLRTREGRMYYSGVAPTCWIYSTTRTGSVNWSDPGTPDFWSGWNIRFAPFDPPQGTISIGYACDVPNFTSLHGSITRFALTRIHGGV